MSRPIDVTALPFPPSVTRGEDGTMCLCCGAMLAYMTNGAWTGDKHTAECNVDENLSPDGSVTVAVCRQREGHGPGCGYACRVPWWADDDLIVDNGCHGCTSDDHELVIVHGKSAEEAQDALERLGTSEADRAMLDFLQALHDRNREAGLAAKARLDVCIGRGENPSQHLVERLIRTTAALQALRLPREARRGS